VASGCQYAMGVVLEWTKCKWTKYVANFNVARYTYLFREIKMYFKCVTEWDLPIFFNLEDDYST